MEHKSPPMPPKQWQLMRKKLMVMLLFSLLILSISSNALANERDMIVRGQVYLQGRGNSSGTVVTTAGQSVQIGFDGQFSLVLTTSGSYEIEFTAPGYLTQKMSGYAPSSLSTVNLGSHMLLGGDMTGDNQIDVFDLAYLGSRYETNDPLADLNQSGQVDIFDISIAAGNYGEQKVVISPTMDEQLRIAIKSAAITPLNTGPKPDAAKVKLGQSIFFDKELSGNRDTACSTCHHPFLHTSDGLAISIGTGSRGLGPERALDSGRRLHPRNSPDLFNRGATEWQRFFWDGRVNGVPGNFESPAGDQLPANELDNIVAVLAMFPATARDEMRGMVNDNDVNGKPNELATIDDDNFTKIWDGIMARLLAIPEYVALFNEAYPDVATEDLKFQHAANANAAFIIDSFSMANSPWDRYVAGDDQALSDEAKQGALLFFGQANCIQCHSGNLLTDQAFHNIGVPQLGPGQADEEPLDSGRSRESGDASERFAFRTPPLRNVTLTGPWMHNGAFDSLEAVVRHHLKPETSLRNYDDSQLLPAFRETVQRDETTLTALLSALDPAVRQPVELTDDEVSALVVFLEALTDPQALDMRAFIPQAVPSGLPIED